jgi:hypothetical protein
MQLTGRPLVLAMWPVGTAMVVATLGEPPVLPSIAHGAALPYVYGLVFGR